MSEWAQGIAWSKDLETGNDAIDSQHKELFRLTSNLVEACESSKSTEKADSTSLDLRAQINSTVIRWLLQHIKREDFKIAEHIRKMTGNK